MLLHNNLTRRECLLYVLTRELVHQYNPNKVYRMELRGREEAKEDDIMNV